MLARAVDHFQFTTALLRNCLSSVVVAGAIMACAPASVPGHAATPNAIEIDHIVVAIDSLSRGIEQMRELTGVTAVYGAAHLNRGTHSAWMAIGPRTYLEIQAPNPDDTTRSAARESFAVQGLVRPAYWALHTSDVDRLRAELMRRGLAGGNVVPGTHPRGRDTLRWRSLIPWGPLNRAILPYYMERSGAHPASMASRGCTLASLTVLTPKTDSIRALLNIIGVRVRVDSGVSDTLRIDLDCPTGRVRLPMSVASGFDLMRHRPPPTAAGVSLGISGDSVGKILGTADVSIHMPNRVMLSYTRGRAQGLQVGMLDGRVDAVALYTPEAGMLDGMNVGLPFIALLVRWGEPTVVEQPGHAIWRADTWEIVAHPDVESKSVNVLLLRSVR